MFVLVVLRLVIGWHFFKEGLSHRTDPSWSSEGFLKQAKGPLADHYQANLPKFHQWDVLMLSPLVEKKGTADPPAEEPPTNKEAVEKDAADKKDNKDSDVKDKDSKDKPAKPPAIYDEWLTGVNKDWKAEQASFFDFYKLDDNQIKQAAELLKKSNDQLDDAMKGYAADIRLYRQLVARAQMMSATPGGSEVPFIKSRSATVQKNPLGEVGLTGTSAVLSSTPAEWQADAKGIEKLYHDRLAELLTDKQRALGEQPADTAGLHKLDNIVTWLLVISGGCLIVGLFTRLAAAAGSLFLLSVICSQPPWVADAIPTYNQWVEFVALLVIATTTVGRWGGLDYFIHLLVRGCCSAKGKST